MTALFCFRFGTNQREGQYRRQISTVNKNPSVHALSSRARYKTAMRQFASILIIVLTLAAIASGQDLRTRALESPLDCAYYVFAKDPTKTSSNSVAAALVRADRDDDALAVMQLESWPYWRYSGFVLLAKMLIDRHELARAKPFVDGAMSALSELDWWDRDLGKFFEVLVSGRYYDRISAIAAHADRWDRTFVPHHLYSIAESYARHGQKQRAIDFLHRAEEALTQDLNLGLQVSIAELYLRIGERDQALRVVGAINERLRTDPGDNQFLSYEQYESRLGMIRVLFLAGADRDAREIMRQLSEWTSSETSFSIAKSLAAAGHREEARALLQQVEADSDFVSGFEGRDLVEAYLNLNDMEGARRVVAIKANEDLNRSQQEAFMRLVDGLIAKKDFSSAVRILDQALAKAGILPPASGDPLVELYASPREMQMDSLREIVTRCIQLARFDRAVQALQIVKGNDYSARNFRGRAWTELAAAVRGTKSCEQTLEFLHRAETEFDETDGAPNTLLFEVARVNAQIGDSERALDLMTELLRYEPADDPFYTGIVLVMTGELLTDLKLRPNDPLKATLRGIVEKADSGVVTPGQ